MQMRPLRSHRLTLLVAGALLASPLLSGCGFNYATNRVNTISTGANDRSGSIDVLGAVIIAGQDDVGLFVGSLVNNDSASSETLDSIEPTADVQAIEGGQPVEIAASGLTSLFQTGGLPVSGTFGVGDYVDVSLRFSTGQVTNLQVNVVPPCRQFSLDKLTELTLPAGVPGSEPAADSEGAATSDTEAVGEPGPYSCDQATPEAVEPGAEEGE